MNTPIDPCLGALVGNQKRGTRRGVLAERAGPRFPQKLQMFWGPQFTKEGDAPRPTEKGKHYRQKKQKEVKRRKKKIPQEKFADKYWSTFGPPAMN